MPSRATPSAACSSRPWQRLREIRPLLGRRGQRACADRFVSLQLTMAHSVVRAYACSGFARAPAVRRNHGRPTRSGSQAHRRTRASPRPSPRSRRRGEEERTSPGQRMQEGSRANACRLPARSQRGVRSEARSRFAERGCIRTSNPATRLMRIPERPQRQNALRTAVTATCPPHPDDPGGIQTTSGIQLVRRACAEHTAALDRKESAGLITGPRACRAATSRCCWRESG